MKISDIIVVLPLFCFCACDRIGPVDHASEIEYAPEVFVGLDEVAEMLSCLPMCQEHLEEVYGAVEMSAMNGYDEEYMMKDLLTSPGKGVGDDSEQTTKSGANPMRNLVEDYLLKKYRTKAGEEDREMVEKYLEALGSSDIQIFWPFSENWDGETFPVITFEPDGESDSNVGYLVSVDGEGNRTVQTVVVTESMAGARPVWVVNRNDDSSHISLEMYRRRSGSGDGYITVNPVSKSESGFRTLVLKEMKMLRHYDSWFRGASEFFLRIGAVEGFSAACDEDLKLYSPSVTDVMIVVRRKQLGEPILSNVIMVSDWTEQMEDVAFIVTEDDGGTWTSWKASAVVKYQSKSYGIELEIPYRSQDDIVWRGSLSRRFIETYAGRTQHFGGVDLCFDLL